MDTQLVERILAHESVMTHGYLDGDAQKGNLGISVLAGSKICTFSPRLQAAFDRGLFNKADIQVGGSGLPKELAPLAVEATLRKLDGEMRKRQPIFAGLDTFRQGVVLEMAYQMGVAGVLNFTNMWKALAKDDFAEASKEMLDSVWAKRDTPKRAVELSRLMIRGRE